MTVAVPGIRVPGSTGTTTEDEEIPLCTVAIKVSVVAVSAPLASLQGRGVGEGAVLSQRHRTLGRLCGGERQPAAGSEIPGTRSPPGDQIGGRHGQGTPAVVPGAVLLIPSQG